MIITPTPPIVKDELKHIGAGLRFARNPTQFLSECRAEYGDTFLVDVFGYQLFCVFGEEGLASLYSQPEEQASFGFATFDMLSFKTPIEVFMDTDIELFYKLLKVKKLPHYLEGINHVLDLEFARWGESGSLDIFDAIRTLEQRVGYGIWIGEDAAQDGVWQALKSSFDVLDQESAFVAPTEILDTITSDKAKEREAIEQLKAQLLALWQARQKLAEQPEDTFTFLYQNFGDSSGDELHRKVAHNLINTNQGFLSNLYAALAWVVVQLLSHKAVMDRAQQEIAATREKYGANWYEDLAALKEMTYMEQVLMESVRIAQRSITLRKVLQPVTLNDGKQEYTVNPGCYITTLLSVTNSQAPGMQHFDPDHYSGNKLVAEVPGKHTISTFGHGRHACPAQTFSHMMCKVVIGRMLEQFELTPEFAGEIPRPDIRQMGGVARPALSTAVCFHSRARD